MVEQSPEILVVRDVEVIYDHVIVALHGVSLKVGHGSIVTLLGANGAGKTTTLKAISSLLRAERGEVVNGTIVYDGQAVLAQTPETLVHNGLVQVLEGRHCFPQLTVEENLLAGAFVRRPSRAELRRSLQQIYALFPRLETRRRIPAGLTSGGEQQMVAIGRALMARPRLILLDEPSMGLAPQIVEEIFQIVRELNRSSGVSVLLAEQNATLALQYADHGYILETGRVVASGTSTELRNREDVKHYYLGVGAEGRRSFRDDTAVPRPSRGK